MLPIAQVSGTTLQHPLALLKDRDTMKNKAPAFQFYPKDWLTDDKVCAMSMAEQGIYFQLICFDWLSDGIRVEDMRQLVRFAGTDEEWNHTCQMVERCFIDHPQKEGFVTNPRLLKERQKQAEWAKKSREGGKKSAKARKERALKSGKGGSKMVATKGQPKGNSSSTSTSTNKRSTSRSLCTFDTQKSITEEQYQSMLDDKELADGDRQWLWRQVKTMEDHFKNKRRKDWAATLRNWVRKARYQFNDPPNSKAVVSKEQARQDWGEECIESWVEIVQGRGNDG